jgi:hypothetical protein
MRPVLSILFTCCALALWGQTGNYFLSHYAPSEERFDYVCFDMAQDRKGVMYFATKAGIIEFNGRDWDLLPGLSAVYSIQINDSGEIYWAGAKGFGRISLDKHGFQQAELLSDSTIINVFQTLIVKDQVYFVTEEAIHIFDEKTKNTISIEPLSSAHTFLKAFELFGVVYINTDYGTFKIDQGKLVDSGLNLNKEVVFFARIDESYVIATADNKLYTCTQGVELKPLALKDQAYIDASVIVSGSWLNRQLLALGTLRGGVIFVNPINGITQEIINYGTGLPDNEVFELMTDVKQNVWVAHDYGFTKIAPYLPLRSFSHYTGLQGNLLCAHSAQQTVYVGTSLGLFKLEKVDVYDELVYYVEVEVKAPQKSAAKNQPAASPPKQEASTNSESKKGGLFGFLKRNKNAPAADEKKTIEADDAEATAIAQPKFRRQKRTEKILRSSQYEFKKVRGIDAKITHLVEVQGRLLASGLGGLFEVNNLEAKPIMEEPVRYLFTPSNSDFVMVSTYNDEVRTLRFAGNTIENSSLFNNVADQIHYIFEGVNKELWLCGMNKIYRADVKGSDVRHKQTIEVHQRNTDRTVGAVWNGEVVLANADGFYQVQRQKNAVARIDSLPKPSQYFAHNGSVVYRDQHGWNFLGAPASGNNLQLLNVFHDLRFITPDKNSQNLWLISGGNELYKFFGDKATPVGDNFPIFLRSIVNQDKKIIKLNEIIMDQEHSSVKFEVVQPDYINPQAVEFRYFLKGMHETWSAWSSNNDVIDFPYLPTGEYTLQVEARNIFGKISTLEPLSFEVLPPYWKRSWFYALEFAVFASLVMLSFRLSTRYRIVSRVLSLLTIILLIELIQTAIGATISLKDSSPVIDFFIQVVVALLVLPVEGYLRNLMLKSLDSSGKFYQFIVPQASPMIMRGKPEKFEKFIKEKEKEVSGKGSE